MEALRSNSGGEDQRVHDKNILNSSPEGSPRIEMDTSLEINGGKSDNQQFCLRWNNHQVSEEIFLRNSSIRQSSCY
jgi:hypothetical protein